MLKSCVTSLTEAFEVGGVDGDIKVVLNEANKPSVEFLQDKKIDFVALQENRGTLAIDYLTHLVNSEYTITINDDQIVAHNFFTRYFDMIKEYYPCSISSFCVEPAQTDNPLAIYDDLGHVSEKSTYEKFLHNVKNGKYDRQDMYGYVHPQMVKTNDWKLVGGYGIQYINDFGLAGYCADDYFSYRLWTAHDQKFKFIVNGKSFVYHQISATTNRLDKNVKHFNAHEGFVKFTGMNAEYFKRVCTKKGNILE